MYGTTSASGATGATLAMTGLATGTTVLAIIGLIFAGVALLTLVKRHKGKP